MSYYKITYESDTIEGLKAIQGSIEGSGPSAVDSTKNPVQPPPPSTDFGNADAYSGIMQAPPPAAEADSGPDLSDENTFYPPPPQAADTMNMDTGLEEEIPPPPKN